MGARSPVVARVGGAEHGSHPGVEGRIVGLRLLEEIAWRVLPDDRVEDAAHGLVGVLYGGFGHGEEQAFLSPDPLEVGDQLPLDPFLRVDVDLMYQPDEQLHQRVGDLRRARPAQHRQKGQAYRARVLAHPGRVLLGRPRPPSGEELLRGVGEQVVGQTDLPDALQLADLA